MIYNLHQYFCNLQKIFTPFRKKNNGNKNNKKTFRRCRDVKTQKACEQGWEANIGRKIEQTTSI